MMRAALLRGPHAFSRESKPQNLIPGEPLRHPKLHFIACLPDPGSGPP